MIVVWCFLAVPWVCLQFVIVVFPDHSHLLFLHSPFYRLWFCDMGPAAGSHIERLSKLQRRNTMFRHIKAIHYKPFKCCSTGEPRKTRYCMLTGRALLRFDPTSVLALYIILCTINIATVLYG